MENNTSDTYKISCCACKAALPRFIGGDVECEYCGVLNYRNPIKPKLSNHKPNPKHVYGMPPVNLGGMTLPTRVIAGAGCAGAELAYLHLNKK